MSENPAYPDADPTAPGGMSQKALVKEMVQRHGFDKAEAKAMRWPDQIDAVVQGRLDREREQRPEPDGGTEAEPDSVLDPEALFAEVEQAHDEAKANALLITDPKSYDYVFNGHAGAGPSAAKRWMLCTASLRASREFLETLTPNQQAEFSGSNTAARQGTTAHAAGESEALLLLGRVSQEEHDATLLELTVNPETESEAYSQEMAEFITEYTDLIASYANERGPDAIQIETRVVATIPLTDEHEEEVYEIPGSADMIAMPVPGHPELVVGDLKYGDGVSVEVEDNPQARIYALGALAEVADPETGRLPEDLTTITYHIIQPRLGGIKTWSESVEDLLGWRDRVLAPALTAALFDTDTNPAEFFPSEETCQWCPARGGCAALAEQRITEAADLFDTVVDSEFNGETFPETASLTDTRLGELLTQITGLIDIHKDLKEEAQRRLHRGQSVPGFKLVSYTPPRKWKEGATDAVDEDLAIWKPPALLTPTQALKVLAGNESAVASLTEWIDVPDKRPVVAAEGDRRKTWEGKPPESMFDIEEE